MKVVGIVGSPRKSGNTEILVAHTLKAIGEEGIETELVRLSGLDIRHCDGCLACRTKLKCHIDDDFAQVYAKMRAADGIILGTPVYTGSATALLRALVERTSQVSTSNGKEFKRKVGGPVVVATRAGHNFTFAELFFWFHSEGMFMAGSSYWNIAFGSKKGDVEKDERGLKTVWDFGKEVAFLATRVCI